ncbi:MAG: L-serine ammonia-lyase, iron-sulfur-dependent, subunit alpha [Clostridia bacterium]
MESLKELYRIGKGPSSSHTMGPDNACNLFKQKNPTAQKFKVTLKGSLSKTGVGHLTDQAVLDAFKPNECEVVFSLDETACTHPNTMEIEGFDNDGNRTDFWRVFSVGGGKIIIEGSEKELVKDIYPHKNFSEIKNFCLDNNLELWQYAVKYEGEEILDFLQDVWYTMKKAIKAGLKADGILPGGLEVQRKAKFLFNQRHIDESPETKENRLVCSYAFAVSEENASGGIIVTAPTCGACGTLPSVLYYMQNKRNFSDLDIAKALATGGIIGNVIKTNASISGAECGCQAEIGTACSMASAALAGLFGMELDQIEYAAEVAMEHHLGLTCDPISGLVQIPCIERNAVAAMRAINALSLANFLTHTRKISFDVVVQTMYETGLDLFSKYRETSEGGLAKLYKR